MFKDLQSCTLNAQRVQRSLGRNKKWNSNLVLSVDGHVRNNQDLHSDLILMPFVVILETLKSNVYIVLTRLLVEIRLEKPLRDRESFPSHNPVCLCIQRSRTGSSLQLCVCNRLVSFSPLSTRKVCHLGRFLWSPTTTLLFCTLFTNLSEAEERSALKCSSILFLVPSRSCFERRVPPRAAVSLPAVRCSVTPVSRNPGQLVLHIAAPCPSLPVIPV